MREHHLKPETVERLRRSELPAEDLDRIGDHLRDCTGCRASLAAASPATAELVGRLLPADEVSSGSAASASSSVDNVEPRHGGSVAVNPKPTTSGPSTLTASTIPRTESLAGDYAHVVRRAANELEVQSRRLDAERRQAVALGDELARHPRERQRLLIHNSDRFHIFGLAEFLLRQGARICRQEPHKANEAAELALEVIERLDLARHAAVILFDLRGEAWALIARARRRLGDTSGAHQALSRAYDYIAQGTGDSAEEARVLEIEARLAVDARCHLDALRILHRVAETARLAGDRRRECRALIQRASCHRALGNAAAASRALGIIEERCLLDEISPYKARLTATRTLYLAEAGLRDEARALRGRARRQLIQAPDRLGRLRLMRAEALTSAAAGRLALATTSLWNAWRGMTALGAIEDAAHVGLDLAVLAALTPSGSGVTSTTKVDDGRPDPGEVASALRTLTAAKDLVLEARVTVGWLVSQLEARSLRQDQARQAAIRLAVVLGAPTLDEAEV